MRVHLKPLTVLIGFLLSVSVIWKFWQVGEIEADDDYEIKISEDELKMLNREGNKEFDSDIEKIIKQKLKAKVGVHDFEHPITDLPHTYGPVLTWHSPLFEQIVGTNVYFRSPTYDNRDKRQELIRILFVSSSADVPMLYCHVMMSHQWSLSLGLVTQAKVKFDVTDDNGVSQGEIVCPWTSSQGPVVVSLSLHNSHITNHWHDINYYVFKPPRNLKFGICLNINSVETSDLASVLLWFDTQKQLGVNRVVLYGVPNLSKSKQELLDDYKHNGFLRVNHWQMPLETADNGQHLANLDCLYSNMDAFTFLFYLDLGQYLVPENTNILHEMLQQVLLNTNTTETGVFEFHLNCFKSGLSKTIVEGSVINVKATFKKREKDNTNTKMAAVKPYLVKNLRWINIKKKDSNSYSDIVTVAKHIGSIYQYGKNTCGS